ncbi:MAG: hypothetical protein K8T91_13290 [Planctomycetes bacterium]|nr:hypothetical protein [Planctomycetota bacterium]
MDAGELSPHKTGSLRWKEINRMPTRGTWWRLALLALAIAAPSRLCGEEEPERFLESLRQAGYFFDADRRQTSGTAVSGS